MKRTKIAMWLMIVMAVCSIGLCGLRVEAASKDVTARMAKDKNLKRICKMVSAYTTAMDIGNRAQDGKITLDAGNRLSIAAFVRYQYKDDIGYTAKELKAETAALFGKGSDVRKVQQKAANMLVCTSDSYVKEPYMYCGGEFGDCVPLYKIKAIKKQKADTYQITIRNRIGQYGEKGGDNLGTTTLTLKKNKASRYGYIIKNITYYR